MAERKGKRETIEYIRLCMYCGEFAGFGQTTLTAPPRPDGTMADGICEDCIQVCLTQLEIRYAATTQPTPQGKTI